MLNFQSTLRAICGLVLIVSTCLLQAQTAEKAYPEIQAIQVDFAGFQPVSDQYVESNIQLRPGMVYNPALVDQSIRSLYNTGYFDNVDLSAVPADDGKINVVINLIPKYTIGTILYHGNEAYSNKRLAKKGELEIGATLDEYEINEAAERIYDYYIKKGYADVEIDYRIQRDSKTGLATVHFDVVEENRIKIKRIDFAGNDSVKAKQLRKVMETKRRDWLSWITGTGRLDEVKFKEDLELLRQYYRDEGFLDVTIDEAAVVFDYKTPKKLYITINVVEGERYYLGEMSVEDMTIFTEGELMSAVRIQTGDAFSPTKVDEAAEAIREYYTSRGYLESRVRAERISNMDTREIDIVFRVRESEKFYVESIKVEGNTKTKTKVIIRELALRPGDVFDLTKMQVSESRLRNTRYFEDVRTNPERTNIPGRRDLSVAVREGRTGSFSFGAGFGSVESVVVFAEMRQSNFDLFNWRSGFQGDGQKFRFRLSLGSRSSQILLSFEEPWLFEQRLAFGVDIYRTEASFNSTQYDELRTGFELYLRRRLFELVEGRLSYRLEEVDISGVGEDDAQVYQDAQGKDIISKVGLTLLRDNRDDLLFTRKGNRSSILNEWAGFGGDVNYYKIEGRTAHFIPTFDSYKQSISLIGRIGTAVPYGDSFEVPFYDRFYLGGPDTLRGYKNRAVSPRDSKVPSESIGGNTYAMWSAEYSFRLAEPLAVAMFYDGGFVNGKENDFNPTDYADNWGIGARILILGSPLKLDLGFPITYPSYIDPSATQFHFSFGTRF